MGRLRGVARRLSLRARLMLIGVIGLALGFTAGGVALVAALNVTLVRTADAEALTTADAIARLVNAGELSDPLPLAGDDVRVQVVDEQGRVRAASVGADRLVSVLYPDELRHLPDRAGRYVPGRRIGLTGPARVVSVAAGPATDRQRVVVARSTAALAQSVRLLRATLLVAFPLRVALLAIVAWRPVEQLRRGAEAITSGRQSAGGARVGRLPVPSSADEIHRLAVTLNDMLGRLDASRARQRAFVADAAHELRSPLTNMRTELEVAQRLPDTDWPELAADLLTDVQRLSRLVDDLLLLARADDAEPRGIASGAAIDLAELLAEVTDRYPTVRLAPVTGPLTVAGDSDALARVVANLLDNAVRHAHSAVLVELRAGSPYHLITVSDDGPGVPAAERERVFDRFTRLDDARARDAGGSGLGLAIVRELVRQHGGTVTLADADPGLRVEVRLPAT
jgi:signal transduction histidine kinase